MGLFAKLKRNKGEMLILPLMFLSGIYLFFFTHGRGLIFPTSENGAIFMPVSVFLVVVPIGALINRLRKNPTNLNKSDQDDTKT